MMHIKSRYIIFVILFSLVSYTHAHTNPDKDSLTGKTIKITIASEPDYPPFCVVDKNGKADGFSIELFNAVAKEAHIEVNIKIGTWIKIKQDLADGKIDALPLVGKTPERDTLYDFSFPYLTLHGGVFVRKGTKGIRSLIDLKDKAIIVMEGDNAEEFVRRNNISKTIITTHTFAEAFRLLAAGEYDAVITQRVLGIRLLKDLNLEDVEALDFPINEFRQDFCIAVKKGNSTLLSRLNEGLSVVIANGTYDQIHLKWFGPVYKERFSYKNVANFVLFIFIPFIILISIGSALFLRREVRRRTTSLQQEIMDHKKTVNTLHTQQVLLTEMEKVSKVGAWEFDVATQKITWTNGVYAIYDVLSSEFDPSDNDMGMNFLLPEDKAAFELSFRRTIELNEPFDLVLRLISANGILKWVRTSGHAEFADDQLVSVFGNIIDISLQKMVENDLRKLTDELEAKVTERTVELSEKIKKLDKSQKAMLYMVEDLNRMTAELKQERHKLEASNKELEAFSYSVSHDLRAPLRAMDGFTRIIQEDYASLLDTEGNRLLNIIIDNAKKMGLLIDDLLKFSRLSRKELTFSKINMYTQASEVYLELISDSDKENIEFRLHNIPYAYGDPAMARQVWVNLISNAIKFTSNKSERVIEIGSRTEGNENTYYIKDNGAGFNMDYSNKLFGVFQRLHSEREFEGTGVGLAIVQRVIHRMNGRVWAEGKIDEGATFYFELPNSLA